MCLIESVSAECIMNRSSRSGAPNATGLPLPCPQPPFDPSTSTEDCLSMILYVPPGIAKDSAVPTFMWYAYILVCGVIYD